METTIGMGKRLVSLLQEKGESINEAAKGIGVSPSLLSDVISSEDGKDRSVGSKNIFKMCMYFHVSADYLLGLSEVRTPDSSIQGVQMATGLSEVAIRRLCYLSEQEKMFIDSLLSKPIDLHFIAGAYSDYRGKCGLNSAIEEGILSDDFGPDTLCIKNDLEFAEFTLQNRFMKFARKEEV